MALQMPHHVLRERKVAQKVCDAWECKFARMGDYSPFDVYFHRDNKLLSLAEIRTRYGISYNDPNPEYDTIPLDLDKYFVLINCEITLDLPAFYIVAFRDEIRLCRPAIINARDLEKKVIGRKDRGKMAPTDVSPTLIVPLEEFELIAPSDGVFEKEIIGAKGGTK